MQPSCQTFKIRSYYIGKLWRYVSFGQTLCASSCKRSGASALGGACWKRTSKFSSSSKLVIATSVFKLAVVAILNCITSKSESVVDVIIFQDFH